jgi:hypothetical protein
MRGGRKPFEVLSMVRIEDAISVVVLMRMLPLGLNLITSVGLTPKDGSNAI